MGNGIRQNVRLLLEGREVPIVSATLLCKENDPIIATIDLVPLQIIKQIRPRTQVHIFVRDDSVFPDDNYYEAFEGEVITRQFSKDAQGNRVFRVMAVDYSNYWKETKLYTYSVNFAAGRIAGQISQYGESSIEQDAATAGTIAVPTEDTSTSYMIQQILQGSDLLSGVMTAIENISNLNLYYSAAYNRLNLANRMDIYSNRSLSTFFQTIFNNDCLMTFLGNHGGAQSVMDVLVGLMAMAYQEYVSVPFPAYFSSTQQINNFLFIPDCYAIAPPKCNVIFPNSLKTLDFSDDFTASPTRMMFNYQQFVMGGPDSSSSGSGTWPGEVLTLTPAQFYPPSFSDFMYHVATENPPNPGALDAATIYTNITTGNYTTVSYGASNSGAVGGVSNMVTLRDADFLTNDEAFRGIIPEVVTFPPFIRAFQGQTFQGVGSFFASIGSYMFFKNRFAPRQASANTKFLPFLVPGFGGLVLDDSDLAQSILGKIVQVTHTLSNEGHSTQVQMAYCRDFDESDILNASSTDPAPPPWLDSDVGGTNTPDEIPAAFTTETQYLQKNKMISASEVQARSELESITVWTDLNDFYQELLGCDAICDNGTNGSVLVTPRGAVSYLYYIYRSKRNSPLARDQFTKKYNSRPVPTMVQAMAFIGASVQGGRVPQEWAVFSASSSTSLFDGAGSPLQNVIKNRRAIINTYRQQLRTQRGFLG